MTERDKNVNFFEALAFEQAEDAAELAAKRAPTADERATIETLKGRAAELLRQRRAELREQVATETQLRAKRTIPERILGMTRDAILARLREFQKLATPDAPVLVEARDHMGDTPVDELSLSDLQWLLAVFEDELGEPSDEP